MKRVHLISPVIEDILLGNTYAVALAAKTMTGAIVRTTVIEQEFDFKSFFFQSLKKTKIPDVFTSQYYGRKQPVVLRFPAIGT